jgi:tripartite-type tricarboxylate transporter receptor subunit TctC
MLGRILFAAALALTALALVPPVHAQNYPTRPVRVIIPFSPGGSTDVIGRALAHRMGDALGQPFVVENVPGASTLLGAERVARSAADGYTLFVGTSTTFSINPHLYRKWPYRIEDFAPVSLIAKAPLVLAVSPALPVKTLQEFAAYARARPGELAYGTTGRGSNAHLTGAMIAAALGISMTDVPYKGTAPALTDLMGGSLLVHMSSTESALPLYKGGKIRVLAITSEQRAQTAPEVPTFAELGYPAVSSYTLMGLFAPGGTPRPIVDALNAAVKRALQAEDLLARLWRDATVAEWTTPERTLEVFRADRDQAGRIIRSTGIALE